MAFPKTIKELCRPAFIYFAISMLGLIISIFQNFGNNDSYTLGSFSCSVPSTTLVFIVKVIYIFFWTWVLNLICKDGHSGISWFLVLFPFILLFVLLGLLMVSNADVYYIEGFNINANVLAAQQQQQQQQQLLQLQKQKQ